MPPVSRFTPPSSSRWKMIGRGTKEGYSLYRCKCGTVKEVRKICVDKGFSKSCGCAKSQFCGDGKRTHGRSRTSEHNIWMTMQARCDDLNNLLYGGRGVKVCSRWRGPNGFEVFMADLGPRPSKSHSLDRYPNSDGDYEPGNVRWATASEQARNRRSNLSYTYQGQTKCLTDWSKELGISATALYYRITRWGIERAFTTPKDPKKKGRSRARSVGSS